MIEVELAVLLKCVFRFGEPTGVSMALLFSVCIWKAHLSLQTRRGLTPQNACLISRVRTFEFHFDDYFHAVVVLGTVLKKVRMISGGLDDIIQTYGGDLSQVSMITVAPELSGAIGAIKQLVAKGIVVSLGHSAANLLTGEEAVRCGASCITHLFNAMSSFHHR